MTTTDDTRAPELIAQADDLAERIFQLYVKAPPTEALSFDDMRSELRAFATALSTPAPRVPSREARLEDAIRALRCWMPPSGQDPEIDKAMRDADAFLSAPAQAARGTVSDATTLAHSYHDQNRHALGRRYVTWEKQTPEYREVCTERMRAALEAALPLLQLSTPQAYAVAGLVAALEAVLRSTTMTPVGAGDGGTFVVRPPSGHSLMAANKALQAYRAAAEQPSRVPELEGEVARLREALEPSANTKAAYSGEIELTILDMDEGGQERNRRVMLPWTAIKDVMSIISARAALSTGGRT